MTRKQNGKVLLCAAALAALGACADEADAPESGDSEELQQVTSGPASNAPFVASVKANGTGCPARSWTAKLAADGQSFRILFVGFENEVGRRRSVSVKDCTLSIKVQSPDDQQYAVQSFSYTGYAYLSEDASAAISSRYYFQGNPSSGEQTSTDLKGPYDQSYELSNDVSSSEALWSECGKERDLNVRTTVRLQGAHGRSSSINLSEIAGIKLGVRKCQATTDAGPTTDAGIDAGPAPEVDAGPEPEVDAGPVTEGPELESVSANGTGCPEGTWTATLTPDRKNFKIAFTAFEAAVTEAQSMVVKDCQVAVKVRNAGALSFALKSFGHRGTALLTDGMNARVQGNYYLQGDPASASTTTDSLIGPLDEAFAIKSEIPTGEQVWSTCGVERDLNLRTTVRLANGTTRGTGSVKVLETDSFQLVTRPCP